MSTEWEMYDEEFDNTEPEAVGTFEKLPDGKYLAEIVALGMGRKQDTNEARVEWQLRILDVPHAGRIVYKNGGMSEKSLPYTKGELAHVGLWRVGEKFSGAVAKMPSVVGMRLGLSFWTGKSGYQNINLGKIEHDPRGAVAEPAAAAPPANGTAAQQPLPGIPANATPFD